MKPILFNTEMVRAIQNGTKTATRRVVKPHYRNGETGFRIVTNAHTGKYVRVEYFDEWEDETRRMAGPYLPGDILYVRETWLKDSVRYMYKANYSDDEKFYRGGKEVSIKWRPSIHMPREAARIFLRVTDVRVERLQEITAEQCVSEGLGREPLDEVGGDFMRGMFHDLWDSTIQKADRALYGWAANPWVWVISFERIGREEAELCAGCF